MEEKSTSQVLASAKIDGGTIVLLLHPISGFMEIALEGAEAAVSIPFRPKDGAAIQRALKRALTKARKAGIEAPSQRKSYRKFTLRAAILEAARGTSLLEGVPDESAN